MAELVKELGYRGEDRQTTSHHGAYILGDFQTGKNKKILSRDKCYVENKIM